MERSSSVRQNWATHLIRRGATVVALGGAIATAAVCTPVHAALHTAGQPAAHDAASHYPRGTVLALHKRVVRVSIMNFAYHPASLVVSPGTRLIWTNQDGDPHTVTSATKIWTSEALDTTNAYARVFTKAGAFPYYCAIHPYMHGTIIVKK